MTVNTILCLFLSSNSERRSLSSDIELTSGCLPTTLITSLEPPLRSFASISLRAIQASIVGSLNIVCLQTLFPSTFLFFMKANVAELPSPNIDFIRSVISFSNLNFFALVNSKRPDIESEYPFSISAFLHSDVN